MIGRTRDAVARALDRRRLRIVDRRLEGPHGPLPVRVYGRRDSGPAPIGLVWAHGGGFAYGDLDMREGDAVARSLARRGIPVVSVDYRLAPQFRGARPPPPGSGVHFPVPSEEVEAAFLWAVTDPEAPAVVGWALGGASAGADLAAGVALRLRDAAGPQPRLLLLVYPIVHFALPEPSAELVAATAELPQPHRFDADGVRRMNENYLGHAGPSDSPYAFPGGRDLAGLPPVRILDAEVDTLRASGEAFAAELAAIGADVEHVVEPGTRHGHLNRIEPGARRSLDRMAAWLHAAASARDAATSH